MTSSASPIEWSCADSGLLIVVLTLVLVVQALQSHVLPLNAIHEVRVLETAREMNERSDWIVPWFRGEPRLEKPPLTYWTSQLAFRIAGEPSVRAARIVAVLLAAAMLAATWLIARDLEDPRVAFVAAAILAGGMLCSKEFAKVTADPFLASLVTVSIAGFSRQFRTACFARIAWALLAYVGLALAVLAKGPIAIVFVAIGVWFVRAAGRPRRATIALNLLAFMLAMAPVLIWVALVVRDAPEGLAVWRQEVVGRVTGDMEERRPFWYYGPILLAAIAPWFAYFIAGLIDREPRRNVARRWFLAAFAVLLLISSRKAAYLLPLMPPASIFMARFAVRSPGRRAWITAVQAIIILIAAAMLMGAAWACIRHWTWSDHALAASLLVTMMWTIYCLARKQDALRPALIAGVLLLALTAAVERSREPLASAQMNMGSFIRRTVPGDAPLLSVDGIDPRIAFYAGRTPSSAGTLEDALRVASTSPYVLTEEPIPAADLTGIDFTALRLARARLNRRHSIYLYRLTPGPGIGPGPRIGTPETSETPAASRTPAPPSATASATMPATGD